MQLRIHQLLTFFVVALYCSNAYLFFYLTKTTNFKPLYWDLIVIFSSLFLLLISRTSFISRSVPRDLTIWWSLLLFSSLVCFIYSPQSEPEVQALTESFRITVLFFIMIILFQLDDGVRIARLSLLIVVLFSVVINLIDFIMPIWTKVPGRAAGLYVNPTISGTMLVLSMIISITLLPKNVRLEYCLFVGLGVFVTFSRGAWLLWALAFVGLIGAGCLLLAREKFSLILIVFFSSLLMSVILFSLFSGKALVYLETLGLEHYLTSNTLERLGGTGAAFSDSSATSRVAAANKGFEIFANNPWLGAGLGVDRGWEVGTHNTFLRIAAEGGVFRLSIFVGLLFTLWRMTNGIGKVFLSVYILSSMFSHSNLEQPALFVLLALVAISYKENVKVSKM